MPMILFEIWQVFLRLNSARTSNGFGANPLTYLEIDAFCRLTNQHFSSFELDIIKQLDSLVLKQITKEKK
jgi:hypothetical protein